MNKEIKKGFQKMKRILLSLTLLFAIAASAAQSKFDGTFESGEASLKFWKKNYSSASYPASLVKTSDFLSGETSLKLSASPESTLSVIGAGFNFEQNKNVELTFWAKDDGAKSLTVFLEVWNPKGHKGEHLYVRKEFKLSDSWKLYSVKLAIPSDIAKYPDISAGNINVKLLLPKSKGAVLLDNIEYRITER